MSRSSNNNQKLNVKMGYSKFKIWFLSENLTLFNVYIYIITIILELSFTSDAIDYNIPSNK